MGSNNTTFRNRIINGAMVIDQRNAGASVTPTATSYTLDRWRASLNVASKYSVQQVSTSLDGFSRALKVTSTSAYSVSASDYFFINQTIEGFNIADLNWGTANAKTITVSFWVQSSLTGTFSLSIREAATGSSSYPTTYTISTANTWTYITITIPGSTIGTWSSTNTASIEIDFGLGLGTNYLGVANSWAASNYLGATGATSVVGTNGATFYITGVQLEAGSTASPFEYRSYGAELALCYRYARVFGAGLVGNTSGGATQVVASAQFPVLMRTAPTASLVSGATISFIAGTTTVSATSPAISTSIINASGFMVLLTTFAASGGFSDQRVAIATTDNWILTSAEL
jgi:hypothetical protein